MGDGLALLVEDTHVHAAGVEIDAAAVAVLLSVESRARPPFEVVSVYPAAYRVGALEGGPQTWSLRRSGRLRRELGFGRMCLRRYQIGSRHDALPSVAIPRPRFPLIFTILAVRYSR